MAFTLCQHVEIAACPIDGIVQQYKNSIIINFMSRGLASSVFGTVR
jgi:hypothetical protein